MTADQNPRPPGTSCRHRDVGAVAGMVAGDRSQRNNNQHSLSLWLKMRKRKDYLKLRGYLTCGTGNKTHRRSSPSFPDSRICVRTYRRFISDLDCYPESIVIIVASHLILFLLSLLRGGFLSGF
ncbi:hypothetical protein HanXRQr2_Chr01g0009411 [Helianthus annuus]|uniref:Uncharacterized protein n=1 Tax=Helianthus annuus TaxID=4232 RepID=A0A9K3JTW9_HELAN|nr:hypothetical protein HanXRQr2_Chr01g0009411 [Helianthus annuus]KAJ0610783.1 hypothetical protein HanHA300_Chr01g0007711 [Helianthus annuus]KAJ0621589.1 hypothetical protein HanIR_Chr01g0010421 [Helianthus annuus]KAJ0817222.1 hypothetical protein HanLR1_Chr00c0447g0752071 [Helianthus annuus]